MGEVKDGGEYDQNYFLSFEGQDTFQSQLASNKLFPKEGILLDHVLKPSPSFTLGWRLSGGSFSPLNHAKQIKIV